MRRRRRNGIDIEGEKEDASMPTLPDKKDTRERASFPLCCLGQVNSTIKKA